MFDIYYNIKWREVLLIEHGTNKIESIPYVDKKEFKSMFPYIPFLDKEESLYVKGVGYMSVIAYGTGTL